MLPMLRHLRIMMTHTTQEWVFFPTVCRLVDARRIRFLSVITMAWIHDDVPSPNFAELIISIVLTGAIYLTRNPWCFGKAPLLHVFSTGFPKQPFLQIRTYLRTPISRGPSTILTHHGRPFYNSTIRTRVRTFFYHSSLRKLMRPLRQASIYLGYSTNGT